MSHVVQKKSMILKLKIYTSVVRPVHVRKRAERQIGRTELYVGKFHQECTKGAIT